MLIFIQCLASPLRLKRRGDREVRPTKLAILPFVMPTTWKDVTKKKLTQGDWSLIIANLIPVIGVWFLNWSAKEVFLVYCLETIIIGCFTLLKLLVTGLLAKSTDVWQNTGGSVSKQPFWFFMLFFLLHYGFFVALQMGIFFSVSGIGDEHGITFYNFFSKWPSLLNNEAYIMLGVFIVSYGFRFTTDFILTGDYKNSSLGYIMFQPYGRIFIQQVTVIVGSIFLSFGAGKVFILVFAAIKIFFEVFIEGFVVFIEELDGENTSIRLLSVSATYTLPILSMAIPKGF